MTLLVFLAGSLFAQFGQNRVQYKDYDWRYIQSKHFDIYFSPDGEKIAEFTAAAAEDALASIQEYLDYQINSRVALIVYESHNDFQETNTTNSYIGQGTGGFTEPFKNRVVFPFEGDYQKFRHVIHHELVHAVMRDKLYGGTVQNIIAKNISLQLPLWYHEGMAEYLSSGWETNSDMFIRDAIINEYLPDINRLGGYFAYRGGQALFHYIAQTYGKQKIGEMLDKVQGLGNVEAGIKSSIGLSIEELNDRWKKHLKREYWPGIAERRDPDEIAKRLTNNKKAGGFYNTSPALSPQGDKIVFISDRDIYLDIYLMNAFDGEIIDEVIESGRTNDFEELNVLYPSMTWAPDNNRIALSRKSAGYDRIYIYDVEEDEGEDIPFGFHGIESVDWSPDGNKIAFAGSDARQSDIYIYDFTTNEMSQLTDDIFSDADPRWTPDSKSVIFSSDRGKYLTKDMIPADFAMYNHNYEQLDLYIKNVESGKIDRITDWEFSTERSAVVSPDGKEILFVSDFSGIDNLYKKRIVFSEEDNVSNILDIKAVPVTNSLNGISQLSLSADGKKLAFASLYNYGYNIFVLNNPFELELEANEIPFTNYMTRVREASERNETEFKRSDLVISAPKKDNPWKNYTFGEEQIADTQPVVADTSERKGRIFTGQYETVDDTTNTSGDYSNYVFGPGKRIQDEEGNTIPRDSVFSSTLDQDGNYLVNKYKISFSPDLIYANAGYSTFYGLLGTTVLSFSDMLGNHRIVGVTSLQIDLKNSDYGLAYYYLPKRINYGIEGFHTARFVYLLREGRRDLFRFRNYGGVLSASYPLSRFYRLDASFSVLNISSENLDDLTESTNRVTYFVPSLSFVHDNTMFGYTAPIEGTRYNISLFGNPGLGDKGQSFYSLTYDFRTYLRFMYDNALVFRMSGGYSGGANPQSFFLGGTENWVNRSFRTGEIPLDDASDFAFLSPALPMRGFDYAEKIGSRYSLMNLELRMPLIRALLTGPLPIFFQNIMGVAFVDMGAAWNDNKQLRLFDKTVSGTTQTRDLLIGTGYGFRMNFIFLWRFDIAWSYDMREFSGPKYYLSLGLDF
ncbi:MAG: hypothetical protein SCALA702_38080 [Melioribacteraceae bacterium]|nr:MAG: hypothetical protein SCALA702_38080 [Melioribacteraceae bacterium]